MTNFISPVSETPMPRRGMKAILDALQLDLSEKDLQESYPALDGLLPRRFLEGQEGSLRLADTFASPLYSDECKRYFAATHIDSEGVLFSGDRFLTEEIILGYIEQATARGWKFIDEPYVRAIMASSHLSEQIVKATLKEINYKDARLALEITPNTMITPDVIRVWRFRATGVVMRSLIPDWLSSAALRIRQVHPEYEGSPDEWIVKVFCGE